MSRFLLLTNRFLLPLVLSANQIGGDCVEVASIDDKEDFSETSRCMESIGLGPDQQEGVFRVSVSVKLLLYVVRLFVERQLTVPCRCEGGDVLSVC